MKSKTLFTLLFILMPILSIQAQVYVYRNASIKMLSGDQRDVYDLWADYLNSWNNPSDKDRCEKWVMNEPCDLLESGFFNPSLYKLGFSEQTLSIIPIDPETFEITSLFYWVDKDLSLNPMAITTVLAIKQNNGIWKLKNYLVKKTENWKIKKVDNIIYHYPSTYLFKRAKAEQAVKFTDEIEKGFKLSKKAINYYIFDNCYEQIRIRGFYYLPNLGVNKDCGFFDAKNNIVYSTKKFGEDYTHELIHLINTKYPNAHYLLLTGLAVYNNSGEAALGYSFHQLFQHLETYIVKNDISNLDPIDFPTFNPKVTNAYLAGPVLIDIILEKGGKDLLVKALQSIKTDENLRNFISEELQLSNEEYSILALSIVKDMSKNDFIFKLF